MTDNADNMRPIMANSYLFDTLGYADDTLVEVADSFGINIDALDGRTQHLMNIAMSIGVYAGMERGGEEAVRQLQSINMSTDQIRRQQITAIANEHMNRNESVMDFIKYMCKQEAEE